MATSLTAVGILWATLSLAAAILCCSGFYLPFWIQGRLLGKVDAYFSSFRRCNYPRVSPQGVVEIVEECGRYSRFWDIPSPWWQASTVLVGTGSALSLLVAVTATAACCITYVVHTGSARVAGSLQLIAVPVLQTKWKSLRDRYMRDKKKLSSGSGAKTVKEWPLKKVLMFLEKSRPEVATVTNFNTTTENDVVELSDCLIEDLENVDTEMSGTPTEDDYSFPSNHRKKRKIDDSIELKILDAINKEKQVVEDESYTFCMSLVPIFKRLAPKKRAILKMQCLQACTEAEFGEEGCYIVNYKLIQKAILVMVGAALYPIGWDNREVRESCGNSSHIYRLGTCELSWSVYLLSSAVLLLLLCFCLSFCASRVKAGSFRI